MGDRHLAENLRWACSTKPSISLICRELGINRQQFNRYVTGESRPSAYNLSRIASYFGLTPADFERPEKSFRERFREIRNPGNAISDLVQSAFPGDVAALRPYLGYYQTYHTSPSWPGMIIRAFCSVYEHEGLVYVKTVERIRDPGREISQLGKYQGLVSYLRDRIFIVEKSTLQHLVSETILLPATVHQKLYLKGMTFGLSWRQANLPYASPMIWRHLGTVADIRKGVAECGALSIDSAKIPPLVRDFIGDSSARVGIAPGK